MKRAFVTVLGKDMVGIIYNVSSILAAANVNILDISQTTQQEFFTMTMLVDVSGLSVDYTELADKLNDKGKEMGLQIRIQREEIFNSMHRI